MNNPGLVIANMIWLGVGVFCLCGARRIQSFAMSKQAAYPDCLKQSRMLAWVHTPTYLWTVRLIGLLSLAVFGLAGLLFFVPGVIITEDLRKFLGFAFGPSLCVTLVIAVFYVFRTRKPDLRRLLRVIAFASAVTSLFSIGVAFVGSVLEMPFVYIFTVPHVKSAMSPSGVPVSHLIDFNRYRVVIDDYFSDWCGNYENLIVVRLDDKSTDNASWFAFDSRSEVLVPMTQATAARFPDLAPSWDIFVQIGELNGSHKNMQVGDGPLVLPEKWFRAATKD